MPWRCWDNARLTIMGKEVVVENPWLALPSRKPYVLVQDKQTIMDFNKQRCGSKHEIHVELIPEPFSGNPNAKIVILQLNPGYDPGDHRFHSSNSVFRASLRHNLEHAEQEYPFHLLNPKFSAAPGYQYWEQKLRHLIETYGLKRIANEVFCVQFFPYHSKEYKGIGRILESQRYNFHLVRRAIKNRAVIILMRSKDRWLREVPELSTYQFHTLRSARNPMITRNNTPSGYNAIERVLGYSRFSTSSASN